MKNLLIDCDPGHDDALALIAALGNHYDRRQSNAEEGHR